jgi:hypothetical protein
MSTSLLTSQIGKRIFLPGHFDVPVVLEDARPLGSDDSAGYECRVRLPDGSLEEAVISAEEVVAVLGKEPDEAKAETPVDAEKLRLLIESAAALTRTVLQRRLVSSTCAIHESIKRQLKKQEDLLEELEGLTKAQRAKRLAALQGRLPDAEQDEDDLDDAVRDQLVDEYTAAAELEQLRAEISALKELVEQARRVREKGGTGFQPVDSKLAALKKCLGEAQFISLADGRGKLLIFTEHRDTLGYVRDHLERWGFSTCEIHGGLNPHERKRAQEVFRTGAQVCIATEAAGEGINLQFCHLMINYDMPWNPTRLEQRLGRSHVDFSAWERRNLEVEERRLMPRYVEAQFVAAAKEVGLRIEPRADHKHHLEQDAHVNAVLMGPGHPLYAAVDEKLGERLAGMIAGVGFFVDPLCREPYRIHLFEISIRGKDSKENDVPLYGEIVAVREEGGQASGLSDGSDGRDARRPSRAGLPVKHVGTAFVQTVEQASSLFSQDLSAWKVDPLLDPNIRRQSEIAAEDKVIEALVAEGFPQDRIERVGHLKLGFDIRAHKIADLATGEVFVKRVELKGHLRGQPVRLTTNEWYKAQQLAETYWLYVVWDPLGASPELMRIHNPVAKLDHAKREIVAARFYEISAEAIVSAGKSGR